MRFRIFLPWKGTNKLALLPPALLPPALLTPVHRNPYYYVWGRRRYNYYFGARQTRQRTDTKGAQDFNGKAKFLTQKRERRRTHTKRALDFSLQSTTFSKINLLDAQYQRSIRFLLQKVLLLSQKMAGGRIPKEHICFTFKSVEGKTPPSPGAQELSKSPSTPQKEYIYIYIYICMYIYINLYTAIIDI